MKIEESTIHNFALEVVGNGGKDPLLTAHSAIEVFFRFFFGRPFRGSPLDMCARMDGNDYRVIHGKQFK